MARSRKAGIFSRLRFGCGAAGSMKSRLNNILACFRPPVPKKLMLATFRKGDQFGLDARAVARPYALDLSVVKGESGKPLLNTSWTSGLVKQVQHGSCFSCRSRPMNENLW